MVSGVRAPRRPPRAFRSSSPTSSIRAAVDEVVARHGRIDVLVNNAGLGTNHDALDATEEEWDELMAVNLRGLFFTCQAATAHGRPRLRADREPELAGRPRRHPRHAAYSASKGGVELLTKVLALEWGPHGVTVNAVAPTFVRTPAPRSGSTGRVPPGRGQPDPDRARGHDRRGRGRGHPRVAQRGARGTGRASLSTAVGLRSRPRSGAKRTLERPLAGAHDRLAVRDEHALHGQLEQRLERTAQGVVRRRAEPAFRTQSKGRRSRAASPGAEQHVADRDRLLLRQPVDELAAARGLERLDSPGGARSSRSGR